MIYFVEQRKYRTRLREYKRTFGFNSPRWVSLKSVRQTVHGSDGNDVTKVLVYRILFPLSPVIEINWILAIEVEFSIFFYQWINFTCNHSVKITTTSILY